MSRIDELDLRARYGLLARDCLETARTVASEARTTLEDMAQICVRLAGPEAHQGAEQQQKSQRHSWGQEGIGPAWGLRGQALKRTQRPFFRSVGLSRTYRQKQALRRGSVGADSLLKLPG
jgi:hypothetical protein